MNSSIFLGNNKFEEFKPCSFSISEIIWFVNSSANLLLSGILFIIAFISADKFLLSLFDALGTFDIISEAEFSLWEFFI